MHKHTFILIDTLKKRYRCDCGVIGYRLGRRIVPMTCSQKLKGSARCGAEAVVANGERNQSRCAAHASETKAA